MSETPYNFWRRPIRQILATVEADCNRAGLDLRAIIREAGIDRTTWRRWKRGAVVPSLGTFREVMRALDRHLNRNQS